MKMRNNDVWSLNMGDQWNNESKWGKNNKILKRCFCNAILLRITRYLINMCKINFPTLSGICVGVYRGGKFKSLLSRFRFEFLRTITHEWKNITRNNSRLNHSIWPPPLILRHHNTKFGKILVPTGYAQNLNMLYRDRQFIRTLHDMYV